MLVYKSPSRWSNPSSPGPMKYLGTEMLTLGSAEPAKARYHLALHTESMKRPFLWVSIPYCLRSVVALWLKENSNADRI